MGTRCTNHDKDSEMRGHPTPKTTQRDLFSDSGKCSACSNKFLQTKLQSHGTLGQKIMCLKKGKELAHGPKHMAVSKSLYIE